MKVIHIIPNSEIVRRGRWVAQDTDPFQPVPLRRLRSVERRISGCIQPAIRSGTGSARALACCFSRPRGKLRVPGKVRPFPNAARGKTLDARRVQQHPRARALPNFRIQIQGKSPTIGHECLKHELEHAGSEPERADADRECGGSVRVRTRSHSERAYSEPERASSERELADLPLEGAGAVSQRVPSLSQSARSRRERGGSLRLMRMRRTHPRPVKPQAGAACLTLPPGATGPPGRGCRIVPPLETAFTRIPKRVRSATRSAGFPACCVAGFQPANGPLFRARPRDSRPAGWKSATQPVWKPALRPPPPNGGHCISRVSVICC